MKYKRFNYYYHNTPIRKQHFLSTVPSNWQQEVNEYGEYSYGGYKAIGVES